MLLAIDCSSKTASAALCDGRKLLGQVFLNAGLTHSETLLPIISQLLENTRVTTSQLEAIAVTQGPGSFTGLRIGISTVLGLAWTKELLCCGVSTLEAAAWNVYDHAGHYICAVMDARRDQVYCAVFEPVSGKLSRVIEDSALPIDKLEKILKDKRVILVGDGAQMCYNKLSVKTLELAPEQLRFPTGYGVALAAWAQMETNGVAFKDASLLRPEYLRIPQAERERLKEDTLE